jgi:hypothetical protein
MLIKGHILGVERFQVAGIFVLISPLEDKGHEGATYTLALIAGRDAQQLQVPMRTVHTLVVYVIKVPIGVAKTPICVSPETLLHLIHVAGNFHGFRRLKGERRCPNGSAIGLIQCRGAYVDPLMTAALSYELGKQPGELAPPGLRIRLCV